MQQPTPTFPDVFTKDDDRTSDEIAIFLRSESLEAEPKGVDEEKDKLLACRPVVL